MPLTLALALPAPSQGVIAFGTSNWHADDGCAVPQSLHLHRFRAGFNQPECVYVRMVNPQSDSRWAPVMRRSGLSVPELAYEVHYERYGTGWMVAATWLLPVRQVAGDMAAVQWAHAMVRSRWTPMKASMASDRQGLVVAHSELKKST
jgi:hypothetical protein